MADRGESFVHQKKGLKAGFVSLCRHKFFHTDLKEQNEIRILQKCACKSDSVKKMFPITSTLSPELTHAHALT